MDSNNSSNNHPILENPSQPITPEETLQSQTQPLETTSPAATNYISSPPAEPTQNAPTSTEVASSLAVGQQLSSSPKSAESPVLPAEPASPPAFSGAQATPVQNQPSNAGQASPFIFVGTETTPQATPTQSYSPPAAPPPSVVPYTPFAQQAAPAFPAPVQQASYPSYNNNAPAPSAYPPAYGAPGYGSATPPAPSWNTPPAPPTPKSAGGAKIAASLLAVLLVVAIAFGTWAFVTKSALQTELLATAKTLEKTEKNLNSTEELLSEAEEKLAEASTQTGGGSSDDKALLFDKYACFVFEDDDQYYHTYECPDFTSEVEFLIYDILVAEHYDYVPHPECYN